MNAVFVGGRYAGRTVDVDEIYWTPGMWNGFETPDYSEIRASGGLAPRAELDHQPKVSGYVGPMWDGGMLRYETVEVYDALSR